MDSTLVQTLFNFIANNIFPIIFIFVFIETVLVVAIVYLLKKQEHVLKDVSDNLLKGFKDAPDKDSDQTINDRINVALDFIRHKIQETPQLKRDFAQNASKVSQRSLYARHYKIEIYASVISTLVQIFPLLGILGTILAIAQTAFSSGGAIDVASLSNAFVLAMDTTILGISFSILFMIIDSVIAPKIERVITESDKFKRIVTDVSTLSNG